MLKLAAFSVFSLLGQNVHAGDLPSKEKLLAPLTRRIEHLQTAIKAIQSYPNGHGVKKKALLAAHSKVLKQSSNIVDFVNALTFPLSPAQEATFKQKVKDLRTTIQELRDQIPDGDRLPSFNRNIRSAQETFLNEIDSFEANVLVPQTAWQAFFTYSGDRDVGQGAFISSNGHFLSTMHWSGGLMPEEIQKTQTFGQIKGYFITNRGPVAAAKNHLGVDEISFLGRGYFPEFFPKIPEEHRPLWDDYLIARTLRGSPHCLSIAENIPQEGETVYVLTYRGAIPARFYDSVSTFEKETGFVDQYRDARGWVGRVTDSPLFYWIEGPIMHGDSSGVLINQKGQLLGTLSRSGTYKIQHDETKTFGEVVSAREILRNAISYLGREKATKLFECKPDDSRSSFPKIPIEAVLQSIERDLPGSKADCSVGY